MQVVGEQLAKIFTPHELAVFQLLSDGKFHSGVELGNNIGISKAAINNLILNLQDAGMEVHAVKGKGYQLAYVPNRIEESPQLLNCLPKFYHFDSVASTNLYLLAHPEYVDGTVVLAEYQSHGRGRRGKVFQCSYGTQLLLSYAIHFAEVSAIYGLSILIGIAVVRVLKALGVAHVGIKWPNDVYIAGKKVSGILVESTVNNNGAFVVVGIGINIAKRFIEELPEDLQPIITAVEEHIPQEVDRTSLLLKLCTTLQTMLATYRVHGLLPFLEEYTSCDIYAKQPVALKNEHTAITGINLGITESGTLKLQTAHGLELINCGEMSLRPIKQA